MGVIAGALGSERESRGGRYLMRQAISMHSASACKQRSGPSARAEGAGTRANQRSSEVVIRGRHQYSRRCSSFSPLEQRSSMPTRRYTHLMREAISMHALSMHSARTQHALITHSARTHHAHVTHSSRTQHALIRTR